MAIYGIDLGTTNSCIASVNKFGQAQVYENLASKTTTPSVVYFEKEDSVVVGEQAKEMIPIEPQKVVECIKRDLRNDQKYDKNNGLPFDYNPTQISSMILKKVVNDLETMSPTHEKVEEVVITVPANFSETHKQRTREAGIMAGLNVRALITEPEAAAYYYGVANNEDENVLIFDLGGGTFDLCLLKITKNIMGTLTLDGVPNLGGKDWDAALAEFAIKKINEEKNENLKFDPQNKLSSFYGVAMQAAERTKIGLTSSASGKAKYALQFEGHSYNVDISKEEFENATSSLLQQAIDKTDFIFKKIEDNGWDAPKIIILVGGSSKMPQVKSCLEERYHLPVKMSDPDTCVAKGAAIYAATIGDIPNPVDGRKVRPAASKSYGLEVLDENENSYCCNIIIKDSPIPEDGLSQMDTFSTIVDNQRSAMLSVYENNIADRHVELDKCSVVKEVRFELSGNSPRGSRLDVEYHLDRSGLLSVLATTPDGRKCNFEVQAIGVSHNEASIQRLDIDVE